MSLNRLQLIGRLGMDAKITQAAGKELSSFTVATEAIWIDSDGTKQKTTEWHRVVAWNQLAAITPYLKRGRLVFVEGTLCSRQWRDEGGILRRVVQVLASKIELLDKKPSDTANESRAAGNHADVSAEDLRERA